MSTHQQPRRNSLRLQASPVPPPIPPSLLSSPYLNAPLFTRNLSSSSGPTDAAERWLQDTVPQRSQSPGDRRGSIVHRTPSAHTPLGPPNPPPQSGPLTPVADAGTLAHPPSPLPSLNRNRYLAHSLAPPPGEGDNTLLRPSRIPQARSVPTMPRTGCEHSYFPNF